jgi:hypothetical protein
VCAVLGVVLIFYLIKHKNKLLIAMLLLWLSVGIALFGLYKKPIYDYYLEFMFPLPFLLFANFVSEMITHKKYKNITKWLALALDIVLASISIYNHPFKNEPNRQKQQMEQIAQFVLSKTNSKPFNFALLAHGNSDYAYRYFFEIANSAPVTIENPQNDPERKTVTDQLFVVCEVDCDPIGHPLWEIAGFGPAQIADEWKVSVVKVYRLIPESKSQ